MTVVYVDILFLVNFALDYMSLYLSARWKHIKVRKGRLILSAVFLSTYSLWALLYCASYLLLFVSLILAVLVGIQIALKPRGIKNVVICTIIYLFISGAFAGIISFLYRFLLQYSENIKEYSSAESKVLVFTALTMISGILIYFGNRLVASNAGETEVHAKVYIDAYSLDTHLLVDSGNRLIDPLSGKRVVVITPNAAERLFGDGWSSQMFLPTRQRCICVETIAGKSILPAFIIDKIVICDEDYDCIIAVQANKNIEGYDGIFPAALLGE